MPSNPKARMEREGAAFGALARGSTAARPQRIACLFTGPFTALLCHRLSVGLGLRRLVRGVGTESRR